MQLAFSTKAGTLASLAGKLSEADIPAFAYVSVEAWRRDRKACIDHIQSKLDDGPYIVRSSCRREDAEEQSNAGAFLSLPDIRQEALEQAIEEVILSFGEAEPDDEVLVQTMLRDVVRAGVAFSHDPTTCAPYRVINWSEGPDTAIVTSGRGGKVWQTAAASRVAPPAEHAPVVRLVEELLEKGGQTPIDLEFAVTRTRADEKLWLLQVRRIHMERDPETPEEQANRLAVVEDTIRHKMRPHPFLKGRRTVFGVMPDWNPAEIVGIRPKPLALSLYRELVTDSIWAYQRHNYGYRNLRSFPLMPHFLGLPYIDVRLSFNSFIPSDLDEKLAERLADWYIDRLADEPVLHDKVEFEIVYSCYTLDLPERLKRLEGAGFQHREQQAVAESLRKLTNRILHPRDGLWKSDAERLNKLLSRREELMASDADITTRLYWLIEDTKRYGTLPFAGLARAGFVAVQLLQSLVSTGIFSPEDKDRFLASLSTVSRKMTLDRSMLDKPSFLARYGHLRPGTYDILSPRYDEAPDLYFDWTEKAPAPEPVQPFAITLQQMRSLAGTLKDHGLEADPFEFFDFLQAGIELREQAKFQFTRNLSDILSSIQILGEQLGISSEDLAYCDVGVFKELYVAAGDTRDLIQRSIDAGKARYRDTRALSLPPVIVAPEDVWAFESPESQPNFVTQKQVTAKVVSCEDNTQLSNAIVCIPNADPGFDWLFSHPIAGLITAWGGANSHMAIRASELGLPAVIGAGEVLFQKWSGAQRLFVDCAGRRVEVLS